MFVLSNCLKRPGGDPTFTITVVASIAGAIFVAAITIITKWVLLAVRL
jgi:hypothetical protein